MHIGDIGGFGHIQCGPDESYVGSLIQDFSRNMSTSKYTVGRSNTRGPKVQLSATFLTAVDRENTCSQLYLGLLLREKVQYNVKKRYCWKDRNVSFTSAQLGRATVERCGSSTL